MVKRETKRKKPNTPSAFAVCSNSTIDFQLYQGYGTAKPITNINCQGIVVRIEINDVATLMCGDVPYNCLSDSIINNNAYEYVVIPHHASNMNPQSYAALDSIKSITYPIICVDNKEMLGRTKVEVDNGKHCTNIKKKSSNKVFFTDDSTHSLVKKYELDLSSQNSLTVVK